jgi:hypothetical protein
VTRVKALDMGVTEAALNSETPASSLHSAGSATKLPPHPGVKKAPGIKMRRAYSIPSGRNPIRARRCTPCVTARLRRSNQVTPKTLGNGIPV